MTKIPFHFVYRARKEPSDEHRSQKNDPATIDVGHLTTVIPKSREGCTEMDVLPHNK
jgi:hypothetical protein